MRPFRPLILLLVGFLLISFTVQAQSKKQESSRTSRHDDLGERIGSIVEGVIERIAKSISSSGESDDLFSVDSLRKKRKIPGVKVESDERSVTYEGDVEIGKKDSVRTNIIVKGGDLTVYGKVDGDVLVVGGDLSIKEGAHISGNVKVINGEIHQEEGSRVEGHVDHSVTRSTSHREDEDKYRRSSVRLNAPWALETTNLDNFIFRYNRVEGVYLGLGSEKKYYWDGWRDYSIYGSVGWGFKSHRWRGNLGLTRQFLVEEGELIEIGVEGHSLTDTKDQWIINQWENTAAAFLIHEDYRDYFQREGFGINAGYAVQHEGVTAQLKVDYLVDWYASLENRTEWALFGGNKVFRPNPPVADGKMTSILATAGYSTKRSTVRGPEGWNMYATAEFARRRLGGEFSFDQYILDVRRYQPLRRFDNINVRLRVGTSEGVVPQQKIFEIGGLSTLHALPYKSMVGNRMILLNAEYIINGDFLGELEFWPSWLLRGINFIVLLDAGYMKNVSPRAAWSEGFEGLRWTSFAHNIGLGISNRSGSTKLAFVWRTDRKDEARFIFRFARPF
jgi:hypothetical protein